jgi:hypothetical protein
VISIGSSTAHIFIDNNAAVMSGRKLFHCHAVNFFTNILFEFIKQNAANNKKAASITTLNYRLAARLSEKTRSFPFHLQVCGMAFSGSGFDIHNYLECQGCFRA